MSLPQQVAKELLNASNDDDLKQMQEDQTEWYLYFFYLNLKRWPIYLLNLIISLKP